MRSHEDPGIAWQKCWNKAASCRIEELSVTFRLCGVWLSELQTERRQPGVPGLQIRPAAGGWWQCWALVVPVGVDLLWYCAFPFLHASRCLHKQQAAFMIDVRKFLGIYFKSKGQNNKLVQKQKFIWTCHGGTGLGIVWLWTILIPIPRFDSGS